MCRLLLVSNRVLDPSAAAQAGGVSVALADLVERDGAVWFGWSGRTNEEPAHGSLSGGRIRTIDLTPDEYQDYYLGYSNSVLWPVLHNRLDVAAFDSQHVAAYRGVNRKFAELVRPHIESDDIIWVHDYHFMMLALELRKLGVTNRIGFFLHTPFAPWQTFMAVPDHAALAEGLAAYDVIGLQTEADVSNLIRYFLRGVAGNMLLDGRLRVFDRIVSVASFPIGIQPADFACVSGDVQVGMGERCNIIGIDRLDYTKGLPEKFKAFGKLLADHPEYHKKVALTQIAPPTREDVQSYCDVRRELEHLAGAINGEFSDLDWVPINYIRRATPRAQLPGIFRSCRIGLVTPLRDGMNLVAKEYVAAQDPADPGVLVLSRFAGAAEQMVEAVIVNPYDIAGTAEAIRTAIEMPLDERRWRHAALLQRVKSGSVDAWSRSFLAALRGTSEEPLHADAAGAIADAMRLLRRSAISARANGRPGTSGAQAAGVAAAKVPPILAAVHRGRAERDAPRRSRQVKRGGVPS